MSLFKLLKSFFVSDNKTSYSDTNRHLETAHIKQAFPTQSVNWPDNCVYHDLEQAYYQYFIGVNSLLEIELNPFEQKILYSLENYFQENHQKLATHIPRLPDIIPKLLHLLRTNNYSWKEIASLISRDPVLLLEVLKLANSSRFNLHASEDKLEHVLIQLGLLEVRKVIMRTALKPIMLFEGGYFLKHSGAKIWEHSVKTASVCELIAQLKNQEPFEAYLSGLLHNLGMTLVIQTMNSVDDFSDAPRSVFFKEQLLSLSKRLSVLVAQSWEVNPVVIQAIIDQVNDAGDPETALGQMLYQANFISMRYTLEAAGRWPEDTDIEGSMQMLYSQLKPELNALSIH